MARHEFGILPAGLPKPGQRFDNYEPVLYNCISIDDELIEPLMRAFTGFPAYSHTLNDPIRGLNYCGITLIPPESLDAFSAVLQSCSNAAYAPLLSLIARARKHACYLIHYGL